MKLSELVNFRNELDKLSVIPAQQAADQEVSKVTHLIETFPLTREQSDKFSNSRLDIASKFVSFEHELNELKSAVKIEIEQQERPYFQESYRLYDKEMVFETNEYILNRRLSISTESLEFINARLNKYATWKHAGMIIRPGQEDFVKNMVMFDPLYLIDQAHELLTPAISSFNSDYQRRLRPYVINERNSDIILDQIPNEQFGICLAYNYFNFKPLEVFKQYLIEIYTKLKPGGVLAFTFNDCDRSKAVMLVENWFACYTPGSLIKDLAKTIGYNIEFEWHDNGPWTWLELRKPGELTSLRGGQTLAKIVSK
jgi:hypothetical protein